MRRDPGNLAIPKRVDRTGVVRRLLVDDDLIELACTLSGALTDRGRGLAADLAGSRLALAELAHVADSSGRRLHGFGGADLRQLFRFRCFVPWQQHEHEP